MRYFLAAFLLSAVLPMVNVLAAPAPEPCAILDIGPAPKGQTAEKYCAELIRGMARPYGIWNVAWVDLKLGEMPSLDPAMREVWPKYLRVEKEEGGCRLRFTFHAGNRAERVAILNALLRACLKGTAGRIKHFEEAIRSDEACILELERRIESEQRRDAIDSYRKGIDGLHTIHIPASRVEIARLKQTVVIRWAK